MSKLNAANIISLVAVLLIAVFVIHSFIVTEQESHEFRWNICDSITARN